MGALDKHRDIPLHVVSDPGDGHRLVVPEGSWPRLDESQPRPREVIDVAGENQGEAPRRAQVFVVTRNASLWRAAADALVDDFDPAHFETAEEAIAQAAHVAPDAVLVDIIDPNAIDVYRLTGAAASATALASVPIVLVSGRDGAAERARLLRDGAHDFIIAPFSGQDLCVRVANAVAIKRVHDALGSATRAAPGGDEDQPRHGHIRDVHTIAAEVSARNRELQAAIGLLEIARDRAISASKIKSNMLNLVSHELRTPLSGLRLLIDHIQRSADTSERCKMSLRKAAASLRRIEALVDSLLEHVKIDAGRLAIRPTTIDLKSMALELIADIEPLAEQRQISIRLNAPPVLPTLRSDERLVWMILSNLIANAIKYTTARGQIEVALEPHTGGLRVAVIDTGPGIPPEHMKRVFRPFERAIGERAVTPGVGLGLALVMEMVSALDGRLELQSEVGIGSTFVVTLPHDLST